MNDLEYGTEREIIELAYPKMKWTEKIVKIFIDPKSVFAASVEKGSAAPLIGALIFSTIVGYISAYWNEALFQQSVQSTREILEKQKMGDMFTNAQLEAMVKQNSIYGVVFSPITLLLFWALIAFVYWIICKIAKGQATYKQIGTVTIFSYFVQMAGGVISSALGALLNVAGPVFSLYILLPLTNTQSVLGVIASSIELFTIWGIIITGYGIAEMNDMPVKKGIVLSIIGQAIMTALMLIPVIITSLL